MSYNDLSRRELQKMCKEYGLPANKTNAAMASSLRAFLGDPRTNVLARAPQVLASAVGKKSIRARVQSKSEKQEISVATILLAAKPWDLVSHGKLTKKGQDLSGRKKNTKADLSAFIVPASAKIAADHALPKAALSLRKSRNQDAIPSTDVDEISTFGDSTEEDSADTANSRGKDTLIQGSGTVKKLSTSLSKLELDLSASSLVTCNEEFDSPYQQDAGLVDFNPEIQLKNERQMSPIEFEPVADSSACDQGHQTKRCQKDVQPALSPLFRITANVDKLINRATAMLEKFQEWKSNLPQGPAIDVAVAS